MSFINFNAIENFSVNTIEIKVNFLGSGHYAYKTANAGKSYDGTKHIYEKDEIIASDHKWEVQFTFSGPTALDIKEPTIKSVAAKGKKTLEDFLNIILKRKIPSKNISIHINGHSRGAIIAKNVYDYLKSKFSSQIKFGKLELADPYAGPLNRLRKSVDEFQANGSVVIYSLKEQLYRSPSQVLNAEIIIFTNTSHDKTYFLLSYLNNHPELKAGVYTMFDGGAYYRQCQKIKNCKTAVEEEKERKTLDQIIKAQLKQIVNEKDCETALNIFWKARITSRRSELFYERLAKISPECKTKVLDDLQKRRKLILKNKISKI